MRTIITLFLLSTAAFAQTTPDWSNGVCYSDGIYFPARPGMCLAADNVLGHTVPPTSLPTSITGDILGHTAIVSNMASCPSDRTLVIVDPNTFKCAKDLTDPDTGEKSR